MSDSQKTDADANSREFTRGVEAGLNSEDTKYWQAGYELGQGLSDQDTKELVKEPVTEPIKKEPETPLFLKDTVDSQKDDAQGEQDKSAE
ncbi:MAG TPA: hypothetical protein VFX97_05745 [Pyrinomonadaceae bacterium]|nr:hypothetical protein [Pyrinomonadaceae bacterium]